MDKVIVKDYTKAGLADYALAHFGVTINRKNGRLKVEKEFKKVEKDYISDRQTEEDEQKKATLKKQKDAGIIAKKNENEGVDYPQEMKDDDGEIVMHRPCRGGIALGDPINSTEKDGETITDSAPHLNK